MKAIHVKDDFVVPHPIEDVYQRLLHFQAYDEWWSEQFRVQCAPDAVIFHPGPGITVGWQRTGAQPPERVDYRYHVGPHTGTGTWSLRATPEGTAMTLAITATPKNVAVALLYKLIGFSDRHSADIALLVEGLSEHLDTDKRP